MLLGGRPGPAKLADHLAIRIECVAAVLPVAQHQRWKQVVGHDISYSNPIVGGIQLTKPVQGLRIKIERVQLHVHGRRKLRAIDDGGKGITAQ